MGTRIERLRVWLLASAGLLVVVIAGFIGAARYLRRNWLANIPAKLGANVKVDTSGITWSHTYQGQTDYVVHAGREVEHEDGKVALHDVWIKLCGRQQKRADMVRGDEWEWDKKDGVIRALGAVRIELRDTEGRAGCAAVDDSAAAEAAGGKTMRATTSDLIYMEKLGVAATSASIEFESGALQGHAVGADYASDSGTLMLHSAVSMKGMSAGRPVQVEADAAELDGQERVVRLTGARYVTGVEPAARTAKAEQAVLHLRADQTLERIEAQGNVTMQAGGGTVSAAKVDVAMNAAGHPVNALLTGGVKYAATGPLAERRGEAQAATITFDGNARPQAQRAVFTGAAHFVERTRVDAASGAGRGAWGTRELTAAKLDVMLAQGADGKNAVRDAEATGGAKFSEMSGWGGAGPSRMADGSGTTEMAADDLKAHFGPASGAREQLESISGRGHTLVRQLNAAGVEQTSVGDALEARFRPGAGGVKRGDSKVGDAMSDAMGVDGLASAVQTGHVVVTRKDAAKSGQAGGRGEKPVTPLEAKAQQAAYDGDTNRMTLSGGVQMTEPGSQLWASQVVLERATGNAQASGPVNVEYTVSSDDANVARGKAQDGKGQNDTEPVHVLAERAELNHATEVVIFHGSPVRMWREGSQVQAPVIEMERTAKRLIARGENGAAVGAAQVYTVMIGTAGGGAGASQSGTAAGTQPCAMSEGAKDGANARAQAQGQTQPRVVRVASGGLVYSQTTGEADFTGGFHADIDDATIRANAGMVFMKDTKGGAKTAAAAQEVPSLGGKVDHMVASGQVVIDRPGLRATGERLLYTAAGQNFLLTGDAKRPPEARDRRGNVTTGAALEFHRVCGGGGGDTVEVLSAAPGEPGSATGVHSEVQADAKRQQPAR